ncbi:MAG: hypothetical protein WDO19_20235 [Bacteroidota bacterium]
MIGSAIARYSAADRTYFTAHLKSSCVLLKEPVIILNRNQTGEDFLAQIVALKNELNAIGKNFNQAVHKLHTLDHFPEIKIWILDHENSRNLLLKKTEELIEKMNQIYRLWSITKLNVYLMAAI